MPGARFKASAIATAADLYPIAPAAAADRYRHQGPQLQALGADSATVQPVAHGAGDDGEHHSDDDTPGDLEDGRREGFDEITEGGLPTGRRIPTARCASWCVRTSCGA